MEAARVPGWPSRRLMSASTLEAAPPAVADAGHGSSADGMKVMVSVLVVVIFCTLLYCVYCWRWRKRNAIRRAEMENLRPLSSSDLPLMDLASIHTATGNFSKANKLGEGGFGPVYRVTTSDHLLCSLLTEADALIGVTGGARRRRGDRGEAAVGAVAAGRRGVPERGGADRQAAAPQPGPPPGLVRRARREAARLRVPPQPQPRRLPLRWEQERAAGLGEAARHHPGHRARAALPARGLAVEGGAPRPQGQQRPPRQQDEPQDLRLRHGQDLRGRLQRGQHRPRRRHLRLHGAGVRHGGRVLGEVRRVQLRRPAAGDPQRAAQRRALPRGAPAIPHPRRVEAVDGGGGGGVHGRGAGAAVPEGGGGGAAVLPRRVALRAGGPRRAADHVRRHAHAHQRQHAPPAAVPPAALHQAQELPYGRRRLRRRSCAAVRHQDGVHGVAAVHQRCLHHRHRTAMSLVTEQCRWWCSGFAISMVFL